jgi:predicted RNase H-like HicB family nuclease
VLIEWSLEDGCYASTIVELPDIVGTGANWDEALREMKKLYNVKRRIQKLENLIENS